MNMKDYKLIKGAFGNFYVAKMNKDGLTMNAKRFKISKEDVIQMFENVAKLICTDQKCSVFGITNENGEEIMNVEIRGSLLESVKHIVKK